jgi:hypothetical protein
MESRLLKPREVDLILRYPPGRTARLAKAGLLPRVTLPDGEIRIRETDIDAMVNDARKGGNEP